MPTAPGRLLCASSLQVYDLLTTEFSPLELCQRMAPLLEKLQVCASNGRQMAMQQHSSNRCISILWGLLM
jgi:hypothetical protein